MQVRYGVWKTINPLRFKCLPCEKVQFLGNPRNKLTWHSTMELESLVLVKKKGKCLRDFLLEIPLTSKSVISISINCDNQAILT